MHIVYIIGQNKGAFPHYVAQLANAMTAHAEVTVLKPSETTADELFSREVNVIEAFEPLDLSFPDLYRYKLNVLENLRGMYSYKNMRLLREIDPDLIHDPTGFFPYLKFFTKFFQVDRNYPFVVTYHEVTTQRFPRDNAPILAMNLLDALIPDAKIDKTIVHTHNQKNALVRRSWAIDDVVVIPHGTYDIFKDADYIERSVEENTILFFGNIIPSKGIDTLIEAVPIVKQDIDEVKLIIAGSGSLPKRSKEILDAHEESFELHNYFVPNKMVGELFSRAELAVMPYRPQGGTKGHSGALSTAFSFGTPVVTSSIGDFRSLVADSGAGRVVPPGDPKRLAEAIVEILTDDDLRSEMSKQSYCQADRLSWKNIAEQHLEVYQDAIGSAAEETLEIH